MSIFNKQFPLTLDITKPIDPNNRIRFFRGDSVQFVFTYSDGAGGIPDIVGEATKLRVYAKKIFADGVNKDEQPVFSGEFEGTDTAEFTSLQTAGDAGNYLMAVILLDASGEVITAQGVYLDLLENGYAGVYQPSPDFRDQVLDALAQAQQAAANAAASATSAQESATAAETSANNAQSSANAAESSAQSSEASAAIAAQKASDAEDAKDAAVAAKNTANAAAGLASDSADNAELAAQQAQQAAAQAVEITDPEGWRTDTRAMIACLALSKSDSGTLYFSGGSATATPSLAFDTLSVLFKTDFDFSVAQTTPVFFPFYVGKTTLGKFIHVQYGNNNTLRALINGVIVGLFNRSDIAALVGDGLNALAFVFKKLSDGNIQTSFFVNGVGVQNRATATAEYPTLDSFLSINRWGTVNVYAGTVGYSDFRILNFDVSATDAPYTLADYQKGKRLPPFLSGVQLALENYTISRNTTTKLIKDASGNGNDATVSGDVAGDMDAGIAAFVDELKTQISQQS